MSNNYVNPSSIYTGVITTIVNDRSMMHLMPYQNSLQEDSEPYSVAYIKRKIATTWAEITGKISDNPELQSKFAEIIDQITDLIEAQSSLFDYMGSVDTFDDLPKTGNKKGACYNVIDTGANYAWNGEEWDKLSETIDLTPYLTIETFDAIFDEFKQQNNEKFEEINQLIDALSGDLSSELVQRIAAEETARMEADNALDAKIEEVKSDLAAHIADADANAATKTELLIAKEALEAADEALEQKLDEHIENAEMHNATKVELQELQQEVANNKTAADQADATLQSNIDTLDAKLDAHIADADANAATKAELQSEAEARQAEDEALDGRLDTLEEKDIVEYTDISNAENPNRKAIVFKNHDGVFGKDTEGNTRNIAMISKYNVADFGTPHLHTNLNTQQIVTVNDNQAVLTDKNLNNVLKAGDNVTIDEELVTEPNTGFVFKTYTVNAELSETSAKIDNLETALESEIQNRQDADALKADKTELESLEESSDAKIEAVDAKVDALITDNSQKHSELNAAIEANSSAIAENKSDIESKLNQAKSDLQDSIDEVQSNLDTVEEEYKLADNTINGRIDDVESDINSKYTELNNAIASEASTRASEDSAIIELVNTINSTLNGKISDEEAARILADSNLEETLKAYVQEHTTAVFRYKGQVATQDELPTEGQIIGDCYNVIDTGYNFVWDGEDWDKLSETLDLSYLLTKEEFNQYKADIATRLNNIETSISNEVNARQDADDALGTRIDNLTATVTSNKTTLDNEIEAINTTIANHISDATNTFATKEELNEYKSDNDEEIANIKDDITDLVGDYATLTQKVDTHIDHADDIYATKESVSDLTTSINNSITTEASARENADSVLRDYVDAELDKKANETALSAEITARTEADALLNNAIGLKADKTALDALEDKLDEHIADASAEGATKEELQAEAEARANADEALDSKIDSHIAQAQIDLNTKVDKQIIGANGKAVIFNESDGGGAQFVFNDNHASFVGVNDDSNGIMAQIYAKNTQTNLGSRINVTKEGVYYTVKDNSTYSAEDEIAVKKDIAEVTADIEGVQADLTSEITARQQADLSLQANIEAEAQTREEANEALNAKFDNYYTKPEDDALLSKKVDKQIIGSQGKALIFNESDGGGAKFEFNNNHASFVGVNDEVDGIMAQIYAKNTQTNMGSRLNVTKSGIYYTVQANSLYTAGDEVAVKNDITAEANARQEADETLQGNINTLQNNIEDTIGDIKDTLNDAIGDIEEDLLGVHDDLRLKATNADLNAEITARENADTALSDKIDAEIAEAKDELSGNLNNEIATLNSTITEKEQALTQAINSLDENYAETTEKIIEDVEANTQAISGLQTTVATKADASELDNYFDKTEVNAIKSDLEDAIGNEESARTSADETLDAKIDSEIYKIETSSKNYTDTIADGFSAQLASETEAREAADTTLGNRLNTAEADIDALESAVSTKANAGDVYSKAAMDDILAARLASIFKYKGQVATEDNLPDEDNEIGDCYNVQDTDANYAWNGTSWDKLSETIDLTPYLKTADFNEIISGYYNKLDAEEKMLEISDAAETRLLGRIWANGDIEDPTAGHFQVGNLQIVNNTLYYGEAVAANEVATKGDVATVADDLSDNYYTKQETDSKDAAVKSDIMTRIWSKPSDPDRGYFQTKYTHANGSYAQMWNESDGGGSQSYDKTANVLSYVGTNIEEGNSDKSSAINVQIYSKDKTTNEGVRINVNTDKAYYLQGANKVNVADREIAVKADFELYDLIADRQAADLAIMNRIWSKPTDPDKGYFQTKYTHATGSYAQMWNESDGGGSQAFDKTANVLSYVGVNMEEGQSASAGAINVQIYSKDKTTNEGVRINVNTDKAYYLKGATKANTASREIAVKEDIDGLQTQIDNLSTSSATEVDLEELRQEVAKKAYTSYVDTVDGKIAAVIQQLLSLEAKYNEVRLSNVDVIELYDGNDDYFEDREKDYIMNGQIDTDLHLTAKSVTLRDMAVNAAVVSSYTTGDFNLNNVEVDGVYTPQSMGNTIMSVHSDSYVTIRDCRITPETAYNGLEIGLTEGLAKGVIIDNVDFDGVFTNNAISIFGTAENCIITISNCHFNQVSNILRLSNRTGAKCTVNLINCTCDTWETGTYAGAILCQDYTTKGQDNLFAPDKMTINIQNLIGPNGKIESVEDLSTVCGSKDNNQVLYLYTDSVGFVNYDATKYPTINII